MKIDNIYSTQIGVGKCNIFETSQLEKFIDIIDINEPYYELRHKFIEDYGMISCDGDDKIKYAMIGITTDNIMDYVGLKKKVVSILVRSIQNTLLFFVPMLSRTPLMMTSGVIRNSIKVDLVQCINDKVTSEKADSIIEQTLLSVNKIIEVIGEEIKEVKHNSLYVEINKLDISYKYANRMLSVIKEVSVLDEIISNNRQLLRQHIKGKEVRYVGDKDILTLKGNKPEDLFSNLRYLLYDGNKLRLAHNHGKSIKSATIDEIEKLKDYISCSYSERVQKLTQKVLMMNQLQTVTYDVLYLLLLELTKESLMRYKDILVRIPYGIE